MNEVGEYFASQVGQVLQSEDIPFEREVPIGGLEVDFLIRTPHGRLIVLEAETYGESLDDELKAYELSRYVQEATDADAVYVVLPVAPRKKKSPKVVSLQGLATQLRKEMVRRGGRDQEPAFPRQGGLSVFAAMPFANEFRDVYFVAMVGACDSLGLTCRRVDREKFAGDIAARVKRMIQQSDAVIADLTGSNPNVLFEVGFAQALGRPTIHVTSTPISDLPFDVQGWNTIRYVQGDTSSLKPELVSYLSAALGA